MEFIKTLVFDCSNSKLFSVYSTVFQQSQTFALDVGTNFEILDFPDEQILSQNRPILIGEQPRHVEGIWGVSRVAQVVRRCVLGI